MSKGGFMNIFKLFRQDRITAMLETVDGGAEVWLETHTRGTRKFTTSLSIDEIEDLILAEDASEESQAEIIRSAKESAWLEGYKAGELDGAYRTNGHEPPDQRNPYRSQA